MASEVETDWVLRMNNAIKSGWMSRIIHSSNFSSVASENTSDFHAYVPSSAIDNLISKVVFGTLDFIGVDMGKISPVVKDLPFIQSPTPVILSVAAYLLVVYTWSSYIKASGLKPKKEESLALKYLVIFHNLFLCSLSFFMGFGILWEAWSNGYSIWGNSVNDSDIKMGHLIYIFYISKLYEFMDTIIMLLRRNLRQVSYLHVYHHSSISIIWWIMSYRCPGGDSYFSAAFNSWIHVIMYLYYLLAATVAKEEKMRKKYLFWGKYLTMLQMIQFVSFVSQAVYGMLNPGIYPDGIANLLFFYSLSLLLFFGDFFVKKYYRSSNRSSSGSGMSTKSVKVE